MHIPSKVFLALHRFKSGCVYFSPIRTALIVLAVALLARDARAANLQVVPGSPPPAAARLTSTGPLAQTTPLQLSIALPLRNQPALNELLQQLQDPASPRYHRYLTSSEFAVHFGPTEADYRAVTEFAHAHGLRVTGTHANRLLLDVTGSVATIERAFHVSLRTYQHPTESRTFYAPDSAPSLDLSVPILQISGLDNYSLPRPRLVAEPLVNAPSAQSNLGSGPHGTYMGRDFRAAYAPDTTLTGSGQTVGLLQFDGYTPADITYYESKNQLPNVPLHNVLIDGASGLPSGSGGEVEVSLDIEMAISMAPNLAGVIVYEAPQGGSWLDLLNRMATDDLARQLSCSWYIPGGVADPAADQIFQQMDAQGQTFLCASGDEDAYTGLIPFPNDSPYITQVGGTTLATAHAAGAYTSETVWNYGGGTGSGGGISTQYPIPSWQTNISMTANQGSTTMHNIPDVALTADNVYVRVDGVDFYAAGTSCASPLWAGFTALINQQAASTGQAAVGFLNPALDAIGTSATYPACFHDTTQGNNENPSSGGRFVAVSGYDLCTGWGTPAGQNLINALANPEPLVITPLTGFAASGAVGGPFTVTAQTFTLTNIGTNTLTWTLSSTSVWLRVSSPGGILSAHGPAATLTVSLTGTASNLAVGTYSATLWFTNASDHVGQARTCGLSVIQPPLITTEPTNVTALEGQLAAFSATASGGQPLTYQWRQNGTNIVDGAGIFGSATSNLVFTTVTPGEAGAYTLLVTNAAGVAVSTSARLTVPASPPVFTLQPTNETIYATESAEFAAAVVGTTPYSYQWDFNASPIPGATNATLTLTDLQTSQSGNYTVVVTNPRGSTTSAVAVLTVSPPPPCAPISAGMLDWWPGEGNAGDNVGPNNGTLVGGVSFTAGEVGQAFLLDGSSGYVMFPDSPSLDSFVTNITIELWVMVNQTAPNSDWRGIVTKGNHSWRLQGAPGTGTIYFAAEGLSTDLFGTRNINDGQWHHVAAIYNGSEISLYVDGTLDDSTNATGLIAQDSYPACLGENPDAPLPYYFNGAIDEVSLYNRALSANEIETIYITGAGGKCSVPLVITSQPTNETVIAGGNATLGVSAVGSQPLNYEWYFDGTPIDNSNTNILVLNDVQPDNAGSYSVTVANASQLVTSSNAVLTVLTQPPFIITQPASQTNYSGTTAIFSVGAGGTQPLSYQWSFNSAAIEGATSPTLALPNVQSSEVGNYSVKISSPYGNTNSGNVSLTVNSVPPCAPVVPGMIGWWAAEGNAEDNSGQNNGTAVGGVSFIAGEVGQAFMFDGSSGYVSISNSLSLDSCLTNITIELWLQNNQGGPNPDWQGIVSKGNSSWHLLGTSGSNTIYFGAGGLSSDLYGNRDVNDGQWHHVAAVYDGAHIYLYVDGMLDATTNATGSMTQNGYPLYLGAGPDGNDPYYFNGAVDEVSVFNRALSAQEIQLIYATGNNGKCPLPVTITSQPLSQTNYAGNAASLNVIAEGSQPLSYQWSFNSNEIPGATSQTLMFPDLQPAQQGIYSVRVSNIIGSSNSSNAVMTVLPLPSCAPVDPSVVSWWSGEGNANDNIGTNSGTLAGGVSFIPGEVGQAFQFDGSSGYVTIPESPALDSLVTNITIELWVLVNQTTAYSDWQGIVTKGNSSWRLQGTSGANTVTFSASPNPDLNGTRNINDGQWHHVAAVYDGTNMYLYVDGTLDVSQPASQPIAQNNFPVCLGQNPESLANPYFFNGAVDEVTLYAGALSAQEIQIIYAIGSGGKCPAPLTISTQPTNQIVIAGGTAILAASATGMQPVSYQWNLNGTNILGATNQILILANAQPANAGVYFVTVTDPYDSVASSKAVLTVLPPSPTITMQPVSETNYAGGTASFGVAAVGAPTLAYQWRLNMIGLAGSTNAVLTLTNVQVSQAGNYSVSVSNSFGSVVSSNAALTVLTQPPTITTQPSSLTVSAGSTANFNVTAGGTAPLIYQWKFNSTNLAGQTNASLVLNNVQIAQAGNYSVSVTNLYGAITSGLALLTVNPPSSCYPAPSDIVSWWPGNGNANDIVSTNNGTLVGGVTYAAGEVGQAFLLDGSSGYVSIPDSPSLDQFVTNITIELWLKVNQTTVNADWRGIVTKSNPSWRLQGVPGAGTVYFAATGVSGAVKGNRNVNDKQWHHVAAVYDGTNMSLYVDGTLDARTPASGLIARDSYPVTLGANLDAPNPYYFNGLLNAVSIYNRALSSNEIANIYNTGAEGKCAPSGPVILAQPTNQVAAVGGAATFGLSVSGSSPLSYLWSFDGTNLPGATSATLSLTNIQLNQAGNYAVLVTNQYGSVISANGVLTVISPLSITLQPGSRTNVAGTTAIFTAGANGSLPMVYQWQKNGVSLGNGGNVSGATTTNLTLTDVQDADAANYSIVVSNASGSVTSSPALLVVLDPPFISVQPTNQIVTRSGDLTFTVVAGGASPLGYHWVLNGTNINGETNAFLRLTNVQLSQAGNYAVEVSNQFGFIMSSNATLVVNPLYHFVWNQIPTPRFVKTPFAVVVKAQNSTNSTATNFNNTVVLAASNGIPVNPAISGRFTNGIWTGFVTVAQVVTNVVLQATDSWGETGLANPISIVNLPSISMVSSAGSQLLFWPVSPAGFSLETTLGLYPAKWVPVTTPPFQVGEQYLLPVSPTGSNAFYRLVFPGP